MRLFLLCSLLLPCLASAEIYRWTDANGRVHFGEAAPAGAVRVEVKPPVVQQDAAAAERQQRAERFFQARREEQQAKTAAECRQLREQYAELDHGGTFYKVDAQGERQYYNDAQLDSARSRLKARLAQRCN